jgi:hypothetical protein
MRQHALGINLPLASQLMSADSELEAHEEIIEFENKP